MQLDFSDHVGIGAAIGGVLTALRLLERLAEKMLDGKSKNGIVSKVVVVQLDPEVSRQIVETHGTVVKIEDVVSVRDENGAPMVYAPRAIMGRIEEKVDRLVVAVKAR